MNYFKNDMKKLFVFIFCIFSLVFANANANDIYTISDFRINNYDKDATTARQIAMDKGQRKAFNKILERLGIDSSNGIIVSDAEISQMIRSMQIKNEKITNNSYSAVLTLEFSPDYVKYTLDKYKISRSSPRFNSYLIIPVLKDQNGTYLWEKNNLWIEGFTKNLTTAKNTFLVQDNYFSRNALDLDYFDKKPVFSKFENIMNFYNINNAAVVVGEYNNGDDFIKIKISILNENSTRNAHMDYEIEDKTNIKVAFNDASLKIMEYISGLNKNDNPETKGLTTQKTEESGVFVFAPISSITDFNMIDSTLKSVRGIKELKLRMLTKNMATYFIKYDIDDETLIDYFKESGFSVNQKKDGLYIFL